MGFVSKQCMITSLDLADRKGCSTHSLPLKKTFLSVFPLILPPLSEEGIPSSPCCLLGTVVLYLLFLCLTFPPAE